MSKRWEKAIVMVVASGISLLYVASAHAAAARGGEEGIWWFCQLLGWRYR